MENMKIESIWDDILKHEGKIFQTTRGIRFTYKVLTDFTKRTRTDQSLRGNKDYKLADKIIRNTYKTLLSRGQKGCFIYCEDESLRNYIKKIIKQ